LASRSIRASRTSSRDPAAAAVRPGVLVSVGREPQQNDRRVRPSAADIYESVKQDAAEELERPPAALAFSGVFAGATLGFSGLSAAAAAALSGTHTGARLIAALFYPIGFIAAIVGRAQLFTENTLYPVTLVLDERRHAPAMLRLWAIVFATNVLGAFLFALLAVDSGSVPHVVLEELTAVGRDVSTGSWSSFFWSGVVAGWLLALVAWLIEATSAVTGQVTLIWALTFIIGLVGFDHCVSTTAEVLSAVINGGVATGHFFSWLAAVTLGNTAGGVVIVGLLNYGQVRAGED
jgi:formate/nitrite transporter FocA (FNT family)